MLPLHNVDVQTDPVDTGRQTHLWGERAVLLVPFSPSPSPSCYSSLKKVRMEMSFFLSYCT